jgi:ADP-ribose pyrophosphatase
MTLEGDAWTVEAEEVVFTAQPFLDVRRQRVRTTSGQVVDDYYQVTFPDFAICCAITTDRRVITLWQYKHGARASGLTFPAGIIEPGEPPEVAVRRELLEETGYAAGAAHSLGRYVCNNNQGAGWAHLFVLEDCAPVAAAASGDLETMALRLMAPADVDAAFRAGQVKGLAHLAVWMAARQTHGSRL